MSEMTPNDRAFIKVSSELLLLRNDYAALAKVNSLGQNLQQYQRDQLKEVRGDRQHSEGLEGFSRVLNLIGNPQEQQKMSRDLLKRIEELEKLCEAYVRGRDIVAEKLARDTE